MFWILIWLASAAVNSGMWSRANEGRTVKIEPYMKIVVLIAVILLGPLWILHRLGYWLDGVFGQ